jgi:hypothetical protein
LAKRSAQREIYITIKMVLCQHFFEKILNYSVEQNIGKVDKHMEPCYFKFISKGVVGA